MAGPHDLGERIRNSVARDQAELIRRLLQLEAARLNLPLGSTNVTQRVTVGDGGQDGAAVNVPDGAETRLPAGESLLQLKTVQDLPSLIGDIEGEIKKERPQAILERGGNYVLVWSKDATDQEVDAIKAEMKRVAGEEHADQLHVWPLGVVEELCHTNAAVLVELGLVPQFEVLPFSTWAVGEDQEIGTYIPDEERLAAIDQIRRAVGGESDPPILHLQGDAGVGKTRLMREALDTEDISDQVVVGDADSVLGFINYVISNPQTRCILFADEVDAADLGRLRRKILRAEGRIRLVTVGLPGLDRTATPQGKNDIVLTTLDKDALHKLVEEEVGLPEAQARWVAEISAGYPRLAIRVANAVKLNAASMSVGGAIGNQDINQVLEEMLPADLQQQLGVVALFSQVGVEGDREHEIKAIAAAFDLDHAGLIDTLNGEVGQFVSRSGSPVPLDELGPFLEGWSPYGPDRGARGWGVR